MDKVFWRLNAEKIDSQKFSCGAEIYPTFFAVSAENAMKVDENVDSDPNIDLLPLHRLVI